MENINASKLQSLFFNKVMKEIKTLKEAREFVFAKHTCRALDTRWDEYVELVLELRLLDKDSSKRPLI